MAQVRIGQQWLNNLTRYLNGLHAESIQRADSSIRFFEDAVKEKARHTPGWTDLADEIQVWSQDGKLWIGINNQQFTSEAWALEYGDRDNAPNSMFRTLTDQVRLTNEHARTSAISRYGVNNVK
jgi:hypothetical protein